MIRFLNLFYSVCLCLNFILSVLVTNKHTYNYSLINKDSHINDRHFIVRLLYKHAY